MKKKDRRPVDVVVISDVHLGTYGSRAKELVAYMKSIQPKEVILNGDIIDIWQFNKRAHHNSHNWYIAVIEWYVEQYGDLPSCAGPGKDIKLVYDV